MESLNLATPEDKTRFAFQVKWICRAVLASCIAFTALVLCAYALPIRLEHGRQAKLEPGIGSGTLAVVASL